jgi:hypothetical protein
MVIFLILASWLVSVNQLEKYLMKASGIIVVRVAVVNYSLPAGLARKVKLMIY